MYKWITSTKWISEISPNDWIILVNDQDCWRFYRNIPEKEAIARFQIEKAVQDSRIHPIKTGDF